jgi:hypothetical protein
MIDSKNRFVILSVPLLMGLMLIGCNEAPPIGSKQWFQAQQAKRSLCEEGGITFIRFRSKSGYCPACAKRTGDWLAEHSSKDAKKHAYLLAFQNFNKAQYYSFLKRSAIEHLPHFRIQASTSGNKPLPQYKQYPILLIHYNGQDTSVSGYKIQQLQAGLNQLKQWPSSCDGR